MESKEDTDRYVALGKAVCEAAFENQHSMGVKINPSICSICGKNDCVHVSFPVAESTEEYIDFEPKRKSRYTDEELDNMRIVASAEGTVSPGTAGKIKGEVLYMGYGFAPEGTTHIEDFMREHEKPLPKIEHIDVKIEHTMNPKDNNFSRPVWFSSLLSKIKKFFVGETK